MSFPGLDDYAPLKCTWGLRHDKIDVIAKIGHVIEKEVFDDILFYLMVNPYYDVEYIKAFLSLRLPAFEDNYDAEAWVRENDNFYVLAPSPSFAKKISDKIELWEKDITGTSLSNEDLLKIREKLPILKGYINGRVFGKLWKPEEIEKELLKYFCGNDYEKFRYSLALELYALQLAARGKLKNNVPSLYLSYSICDLDWENGEIETAQTASYRVFLTSLLGSEYYWGIGTETYKQEANTRDAIKNLLLHPEMGPLRHIEEFFNVHRVPFTYTNSDIEHIAHFAYRWLEKITLNTFEAGMRAIAKNDIVEEDNMEELPF